MDTSTVTGAVMDHGYNGGSTMNYRHADDSLRFATNNVERVRILSSGFVNIGNGYLTNSNSGLHVGRSSGGTAAGESNHCCNIGRQ